MREGQPEEDDPARSDHAANTAPASSGGARRQASRGSSRGRVPPNELLRRRSRVGKSPTAQPTAALGAAWTQPHQRQGLLPLSPSVPSTADADRTAPQEITLRHHRPKGRKKQPNDGFEQTLATFTRASPPSATSASPSASPLSPISLLSSGSPSSARPGYDASALQHEGLGAPEQDATSGQGAPRLGRAKYGALHGSVDKEEKPARVSDIGAAGFERTVASHRPLTSTNQRQRAGPNGGAKTAPGTDFTTTKIGRSLGGERTRQGGRPVIGSGQMTPTGVVISKRDTMTSHDQQPGATAVKARDLCPMGSLNEELEDPEGYPTCGFPTKGMTTRSHGRLESVLEGRSLVLTQAMAQIKKRSVGATLVTVATAIVALIALGILLTRKKAKLSGEKLCGTRDCLTHANLLLRAVNMSIDPCEDLYGHVCSRWLPDSRHRDHAKSTLDEVRFAWYEGFNTTLTHGTLVLPVGKKARAMYDTCMASEPIFGDSVDQLMDLLHHYGLRWPGPPESNETALGVLIALDVDLQAAFWFVVRARKLGRTRAVIISPSPFITVFLKHHLSVMSSGRYANYWRDFESVVLNNSRYGASDEEIAKAADTEANILTCLASAYNTQPKSAAVFSLRQIERHTQSLSSEDWIKELNAKIKLDSALTSSDKVITDDVRYLQAIGSIFANYSNEDLLRHLAWHVIQQYVAVASYRLLYARFGSGERATFYRPIFCATNAEVSYKVLVLALYVVSRLQPDDLDSVTDVFDRLKDHLFEKVNASRWLDVSSKRMLGQKVSVLAKRLWPQPEFLQNNILEAVYFDFPDNETSFGDYWIKSRLLLQKLNERVPGYDQVLELPGNNWPEYLLFNYLTNSVDVAIGAVSRPLFYPQGTRAMLYGGLGFSMALQMVKTMNSEGLKWHPLHGLTYSIKSPSTLSAYQAKDGCLKEQGFPSVFPEIPAMEIAYAAYAKSNETYPPIDHTLPEDKVFFLTLCYMTCSQRGHRNPSAADCNKAVRGSPAFAEAFSCSKGSAMNPEKTCSFF
ncbi:endothelin-converting enzyme 1-like isoform X2 [Dermacentor variabilis]|uniref:endothelin-converting enzyme 1-like isoform X2 n=1 Tax=Dermacentor variabilis TaxID=34621 RepID=UPI003F5B84BC